MNNLDNESGAFAYQLRSGSLHFRLEMYDLGPTRVKELIDTQAEFPFLYAEYTYKELGRSEAWFRTQCRELMNDQVKIKRELLLVWPMSGEGSVFTEEQLDILKQFETPIIGAFPLKPRDYPVQAGLELQFAEMPDPNVSYLIGIDTSAGQGLDYHAFTLSHPDDLRQIGYLRTNTADDDALKAIAKHVFMDLFPKSIAVVERNYLGTVLINYLLKHLNIEDRVFYLDKDKLAEKTVGGKPIKVKRKQRVYGVDTTAISRDAMMRHLFQIVDEMPHLVRLPLIQSEIRTLYRKKTGKIEHRPGFHDDVLFSWLMTVYADKHEQPVLRGLIARQRGSAMGARVAGISTLNSSVQRSTASLAPASSSGSGLTMDDYIAREQERASQEAPDAKRRRMMALALNALNGDGSPL